MHAQKIKWQQVKIFRTQEIVTGIKGLRNAKSIKITNTIQHKAKPSNRDRQHSVTGSRAVTHNILESWLRIMAL